MPKLFVYINCVCKYINAFFEPIIYYFMKSFQTSIYFKTAVYLSLYMFVPYIGLNLT